MNIIATLELYPRYFKIHTSFTTEAVTVHLRCHREYPDVTSKHLIAFLKIDEKVAEIVLKCADDAYGSGWFMRKEVTKSFREKGLAVINVCENGKSEQIY